MQYRVVFDVAEVGYRQWRFPAFGLALALVALVWVIFEYTGGRESGSRRLRAVGMLLFSTLWVLATLGLTFGEYHHLREALLNGRFVTVEGRVTRFVPMPAEGHSREAFEVGGHVYQYSDYEVSAAFNNARSHGGPIYEGLQVRIADVGGKIARLEVAQ